MATSRAAENDFGTYLGSLVNLSTEYAASAFPTLYQMAKGIIFQMNDKNKIS